MRHLIRIAFQGSLLILLSSCLGDEIVSISCQKDTDCTYSEDDRCSVTLGCYCHNNICRAFGRDCANKDDCAPDETCTNNKCYNSQRCERDSDCVDPNKPVCAHFPNQSCQPGDGSCTSDRFCDEGKYCCDLNDGRGKKCNVPVCLKDEDCLPEKNLNTCVKPITCTSPSIPTCRSGMCQCYTTQEQIPAPDGGHTE
ncbi:MAG: hypothetical protein CL920_02010 [Deltaproteobacteria bacterium]|nr:hypothetical protein [Deltaproteobacteria bacterium]MBK05482.1 hypothetical protein [Deltaproteobacteria bacterium]MBU47454.1 hypothetical protein [Deltaproteobacteria bacterium]